MKLRDLIPPEERARLEAGARQQVEMAHFRTWLCRARARSAMRRRLEHRPLRLPPPPDLHIQHFYRDEVRLDDFGNAYKMRVLHHSRLVGW